MMRRLVTAVGVVVIAVALAVSSAWWMVLRSPMNEGIVNGPWRASTVTGSVDADMYTRAAVAITGLFALSPSEAIYFSATQDDAGNRLSARCSYAVVGRPVAAKWWSITAYADDNFLIPNAAERYSFNMGNLESDDSSNIRVASSPPVAVDGQSGDGAPFRIIAAPTKQRGNWLPTGGGDRGFSLLFRIYNPAPETVSSLSKITLPSIKPVGDCR